jgi:hypothetical protein
MAVSPKQRFIAYCEANAITVEHTARNLCHHLHVYAPKGQRFSGYEIDNLSLWDGDDGAPDWAACLVDLRDQAMPLETDPDDDDDKDETED